MTVPFRKVAAGPGQPGIYDIYSKLPGRGLGCGGGGGICYVFGAFSFFAGNCFTGGGNEKVRVGVPKAVKGGLEIVPVAIIDDVLSRALAEPISPIEWTDADGDAAEPPAPGAGEAGDHALRH